MSVSEISISLFLIFLFLSSTANLPQCLSPGYPCLEEYDMSNQLISVCCSNTKCQLSKTQQMTCSGNTPGRIVHLPAKI